MKVRDIMTQTAVCCGPETNVGAAVEMLWVHNYGMLPVVDGNKKLIGIVTDRDICIALGTRNQLPGNLTIGEVASAPVFTCKPDDEIHEALGVMAGHQVHRLPVIDDHGVPQGVLSMDDILLQRRSKQMGRLLRTCLRRNNPGSQEDARPAISHHPSQSRSCLTASRRLHALCNRVRSLHVAERGIPPRSGSVLI